MNKIEEKNKEQIGQTENKQQVDRLKPNHIKYKRSSEHPIKRQISDCKSKSQLYAINKKYIYIFKVTNNLQVKEQEKRYSMPTL